MKIPNFFGPAAKAAMDKAYEDFKPEQPAPNLSLLPREQYCTKDKCRHDIKEDATPNDFCLKCKCFIPLDIPKVISKFKIAEKLEKI